MIEKDKKERKVRERERERERKNKRKQEMNNDRFSLNWFLCLMAYQPMWVI